VHKAILKIENKKRLPTFETASYFLAVHINDEQTTPANIETRGGVLFHQKLLIAKYM